jgi:hypothetical protein
MCFEIHADSGNLGSIPGTTFEPSLLFCPQSFASPPPSSYVPLRGCRYQLYSIMRKFFVRVRTASATARSAKATVAHACKKTSLSSRFGTSKACTHPPTSSTQERAPNRGTFLGNLRLFHSPSYVRVRTYLLIRNGNHLRSLMSHVFPTIFIPSTFVHIDGLV